MSDTYFIRWIDAWDDPAILFVQAEDVDAILFALASPECGARNVFSDKVTPMSRESAAIVVGAIASGEDVEDFLKREARKSVGAELYYGLLDPDLDTGCWFEVTAAPIFDKGEFQSVGTVFCWGAPLKPSFPNACIVKRLGKDYDPNAK